MSNVNKEINENELILDFRTLTRQNTGKHPMDSGGDSGRAWQQPLPSDGSRFRVERYNGQVEVMGELALHSFLESALSIDEDMTLELAEAGLINYGTGDREVINFIKARTGLEHQTWEYTYNYETDLTQDFQYAVFSNSKDWYYADDVLLVLETHNGADARGGFSQLVVCRPSSNRSLGDSYFFDMECEVIPLSATDSDGRKMTQEDMYESFESFSIGYMSNPMYEFSKAVEDVIFISEDRTELTVKMKNGITAELYISDRLEF